MVLLSLKEKRKSEPKEARKYDPLFLSAIQPQGGVQFKDKYIQKGDGYETCIHIWDYPSNVTEMWLEKIMTMRDVIAIQDVTTMDRDETITSINKSMLEEETRYSNAKHRSEAMDAEKNYKDLKGLYQSISQMGDVVKLIHIRLFVHAKTILELEKQVSTVISDLNSWGFKAQVFLNESYWEWQSLFLPYEQQQKLPNAREGKGMQSVALSAGLPYHFSALSDPRGSYLGTTFTGGNVLFDLFHKDKQRRYYNAVIVGTMGAGKSTLMKKLAFDNSLRGNYIRGIDVTGEFAYLAEKQNGKIISLDGSQGIINPLEIYRVQQGDNTQKSEELSFMQHISKLTTLYHFLAGNPQTEELEEFKKVVRLFYGSLGFEEKIKTTGITNLAKEEYPIFSDLLLFIQQELYENLQERKIRSELSTSRIQRLEKIELVVDNIVNSYSDLFNGHTSIPNFTHEQVIYFSIRNLTRLDKNVFNAQMYNILTLIWDNLIQVGAPQLKSMYDDPNFDIDSIKDFIVFIDESHRLVNSENMLAVKFLTDFEREARKYFGGLVLASQSIRDYVPDHTNSEVVTEIRKLFELTQYKFIMQQDSNTLDAMRTIFEGQINESELTRIPKFTEGDCLLSINSVENLMFKVEASDEELRLFRGGM